MGVRKLKTDSAFGQVTDEQKKWLGKVVETVRQLVALVNNFLDVSKLEAGHFDLHLEPIDFAQLFDALLENFQFVARDRGVLLRKKIGVPPQHLRAARAVLGRRRDNFDG